MDQKDETKQPVVSDSKREAVIEYISFIDDSIDRNVIYLAAGALGLSMTFLKDIVEPSKCIHTSALAISWGLLTLTLLINLFFSWLAGQMGYSAIKELDRINGLNDSERESENVKYLKSVHSKNKWISGFNLVSIMTLIAGVAFLVFFVVTNFEHKKTANKSTKSIIMTA